MWPVSVTRSQVWMGSKCVKLGVIALTLSYWSLEVQHGTSRQITLRIWKKIIVALHKDGVGYKKIANTLKLSCTTVAKTIQRFNRTGSSQNRPRHGRPKRLSARAWSPPFGDWAAGQFSNITNTALLKKLRVKVSQNYFLIKKYMIHINIQCSA